VGVTNKCSDFQELKVLGYLAVCILIRRPPPPPPKDELSDLDCLISMTRSLSTGKANVLSDIALGLCGYMPVLLKPAVRLIRIIARSQG
jgi:hypothetical protein